MERLVLPRACLLGELVEEPGEVEEPQNKHHQQDEGEVREEPL
jgi:hypothetical protein